jgi:hypothetical protein
MIVRLGRTRDSEVKNVLRSGDFEDFDTVVAEGWKHELATIDGIRATAELDPRARSGTYCLRLVAAPAAGRDAPVSVAQRPVSVTTPAVTVHKGQLVYISGWVKVSAPSLGNLDGAMLYDSLAGLPGALRWRTPTPDWQPFELVREVPETGELTLTMALTGLGEIRFDDLQIKPLDPDNSVAGKNKNGPPAKTPGKSGPLDFLKRWPNFGGTKSEAE